MGAFFFVVVVVALLVSAFEKAREASANTDARDRPKSSGRKPVVSRTSATVMRRSAVASPPRSAAVDTAVRPRHQISHLATRQRQHDADCLAKIRRAESRGNPRRYYVYEHVDRLGRVRYVGHGTRGRAWSRVRADASHREMLDDGQLTVRVVEGHLTAREAVRREADRLDRRTREGAPLFNKLRGSRV